MRKFAFFLGKGGVGKTTLSSAFAYELAARGLKVLIVSLDPAHNLGDVFETSLADAPRPLAPGIDGVEVDLAEWVDRYVEESRKEMKALYSYQAALNVDSFLNVMRYSPGTEEYAVLWAIEKIHCDLAPLYDAVVFDTPPTALSLRFLALPSISELWVKELGALRARILSKRHTVLNVNPEAPVASSCVDKADDPVYGKLLGIRARLAELNVLFRDESFMSIVANPDRLSYSEGGRIREELERLGIPVAAACLNKSGNGRSAPEADTLAGLPIHEHAMLSEGMVTLATLSRVGAGSLAERFIAQNSQRKQA